MPRPKRSVVELTKKCISLAVKLSIRKKVDYPKFYTYIMSNVFGEKEGGQVFVPEPQQREVLEKALARLENIDRTTKEERPVPVRTRVPVQAPVRKALF